MPEEISQEDFNELKANIEDAMRSLEILQRKYRALTGRDHVMNLYLTNPVIRATLEPNS